MITEIRRLEHAIQATEIPTHIARDCLGNRQRRIDTDLVQDNAETQLLKVYENYYTAFKNIIFHNGLKRIYIYKHKPVF